MILANLKIGNGVDCAGFILNNNHIITGTAGVGVITAIASKHINIVQCRNHIIAIGAL